MITLIVKQRCFIRRHARVFFTSLICLLVHGLVSAQVFQFRRITINQGLPNNKVMAITQDKQGFMWFGCLNGLVRFDGYSLRTFRNTTEKPDLMAGDYISCLLTDSRGYLWAGSWDGGVSRFNPRTETFKHFQHISDDPDSLASNHVWAIAEGREGRIWVGTRKGLDMLDNENGDFKHVSMKGLSGEPFGTEVVTCLLPDKSGNLWFGRIGGSVSCLDLTDFSVKQFRHDPAIPLDNVHGNSVWGIAQSDNGDLWIGAFTGLYRLSPKSGTFQKYPSDGQVGTDGVHLTPFSGVSKDRLWTGGSLGLDIYNMKTGAIRHVKADSARADSTSSNRIWTIFQSRDSTVWLGTDQGIDYFPTGEQTFHHRFRIPDSDNTLHGSYVQALHRDGEDNLWVGTERGLDHYSVKDNRFAHIQLDWFEKGVNNDIGVTDITSDRHGNIWVSSMAGVIRYSPTTRQSLLFSPLAPASRRIDDYSVQSLATSPDGTVWLGLKAGGLYRVKSGSETVEKLLPSLVDGVSLGWVMSLTATSDGSIWAGLENGFAIYDPEKNKLFRHQKNILNAKLSGDSVIQTIVEDKAGRLWLGTDKGFYQVNAQGELVSELTVHDSLSSDIVYFIQDDDDGNLWLGTNTGLAKYNPDTNTIEKYQVPASGKQLQSNHAAVTSCCQDHIYFGTTNGLYWFNPRELKITDNAPTVVLTDLRINSKNIAIGESSLLRKALSYTNRIELDHDQNFLNISFSALDYVSPELIPYKYILEGFDKNWTKVDAKNRTATYTRLPPGNYLFKVKAGSVHDTWANGATTLAITIRPAWWQSWWFKMTLFGLIAGLGVAAYFARIEVLKRRQRLLERKVTQRTKQLADSEAHYQEMYHVAETEKLHAEAALLAEREAIKHNMNFIDMISHEYRTPLSVINSSLDLLEQKFNLNKSPELADKFEAIRESSARLLNIFETSLDKKRITEDNVELSKEPVDLKSLVAMSIKFVRHVYQDHQIILDNPDGPPLTMSADIEILSTAFSNILDNACKYSPAGSNVNVVIKNGEDNEAVVTVTDEGPGIAEDELEHVFEKYFRSTTVGEVSGTGVGLFLTKRIVSMHDGRITINSVHGQGVTVTVILPLGAP